MESDGIARAHADRTAVVESAELAVAVRLEYGWIDAHGRGEPLACHLNVRLCADAPVLHCHCVHPLAADLSRHGSLCHGEV